MTAESKNLVRRLIIMAAVIAVAAVGMVLLTVLRACQVEPAPPETQTTQAPPEPTVPRSAFSPSDFAEENGYLTCLSAEAMLGIDVSKYQKDIDWQQVRDAGVGFVMVRLGYRGNTTGLLYEDAYAAQNLAGAREAGLLVGAYFYSQATTPEEAAEEAAYALEILDGFSLDLPLTFDWEIAARTEEVDLQTATDCALAFCGAVERAGYDAMVYFNSYQAAHRLDLLQLTDYAWWLAMYDTGGAFPCRFDFWQYTSTGTVPGIEGNVDINVMVMD